MKPQVCPFCSSSVSLVDSAKVYRRSYGFIYLCDANGKVRVATIATPVVTREWAAILAASSHWER
jgi:hypothetical protein